MTALSPHLHKSPFRQAECRYLRRHRSPGASRKLLGHNREHRSPLIELPAVGIDLTGHDKPANDNGVIVTERFHRRTSHPH